MVGLSDFGLYQRTLLIFNGSWVNTRPGEFVNGAPARSEPLISVAVDLPQKLWICRGNNWKLAREKFLGAVSGTAETQQASIVLKTPRGEVIVNQYFMNDHPRADGPAFRGMDPTGATQRYAQRTHWWRYDDPSIMTPFDRMAEMLDRAVRSPKLKAAFREQFGSIISPEVLLPVAGTFFCLFGAEFVGGAAAALTIARLLGLNQLLCDYYFYEPRAKELHRICMGAAVPRDLEQGADLLVEIIVQLLQDLATTLGIAALTKLASQMFAALAAAVPESVRLKLKDNAHVAAAYIRGKGYARRDLLKDASDTPLEAAAVTMYKRTSEKNREILVVREPDAQRAAWVKSNMQQNAKPPWLKARSKDGIHGLVCLRKADVPGPLKPAGQFEVAQLRGFNEAFDAEHLPSHLPMYEMPLDGRKIGNNQEIDYHYTGHGNIELRGHKLVDLGDRFIVVDAMGRPYVSDLDLATRQRPGLSQAGAHLPQRKPGEGSLEDHPMLQYDMNQEYHRAGGNPTHNPNLHGGGGATVVYTRENLANGKVPGKDFWTPREADGSYKKERLIIFIPEWVNGRIQSRMYAFDSWADFKTFAKANNMECPF
jgi:hypothetical protein